MTDLSRYRPNVGVVLFHPDGRVWYGRRVATEGPHNWQFPQGGVDDGEDLEAHGEIEFDAWRWGPLSDAPDLIVPFKRACYEQVVAVFAPLVV